MPVTLEQSETQRLIRLEGAINIACAAELKALLLRALGSGREVCVSLEGATELDVTAVQLLWAAEREAREAGNGFVFAGPVPESVSIALGHEGFDKFPVPVDAGRICGGANCQA
jgi:anti-anti-sigma regulatory factor